MDIVDVVFALVIRVFSMLYSFFHCAAADVAVVLLVVVVVVVNAVCILISTCTRLKVFPVTKNNIKNKYNIAEL